MVPLLLETPELVGGGEVAGSSNPRFTTFSVSEGSSELLELLAEDTGNL